MDADDIRLLELKLHLIVSVVAIVNEHIDLPKRTEETEEPSERPLKLKSTSPLK